MRFLINAIAAFTIAASFGCGVSEPGETSEVKQEVVQSCSVPANCSAFAASQCLSNQVGACLQPGTASAHCACVNAPNTSIPGNPPPGPGSTCWEIHNDCVATCGWDDLGCRNGCDSDWGSCGF